MEMNSITDTGATAASHDARRRSSSGRKSLSRDKTEPGATSTSTTTNNNVGNGSIVNVATGTNRTRGKLASSETKTNQAVHWLRWLLGAVLIGSTAAVVAAVYVSRANQEQHDFDSQLASDADKLLTDIGSNIVSTMAAADAFMFRLLSYVHSSSDVTWPFFVLPDLAVQSHKLMSETNSIYLAIYPVITKEQRPKWENFTKHNHDWVEKALRVQSRNPFFRGRLLTNYTISNTIWRNQGPEPEDAPGPFMPSWMGSPVIPLYPPYNWNSHAYPAFAKGLTTSMNTRRFVVTPVANNADPNDPEAVAQAAVTSDWGTVYLDPDEDASEPFSDMYYPIVDAIDDVVVDASGNKSAIGIVAFSFYWRRILDGILPKQSTGLVLVFENPCGNQLFTYRIDGHKPIFLGFGDLHDPRFDPAQSSTLADLTTDSGIARAYTGLPMNQDFCPFRLTVYASADMYDRYITRSPIYVAVGAASIFIFVAALFLAYDLFIRREFNAKKQLLEAKRSFMRLISHEVRTPLNAVCLGLSLLEDEMNEAVVDKKAELKASADLSEEGENNEAGITTNIGQNTPIPKNRSNLAISNHFDYTVLDGWLHMVREICYSADASVEVLNDLLNYDKIQMGSFSMEFALLSIRQLDEETSRDFKLSARRKGIQFILDNQLSPGQLDPATVETGDLGTFKILGDRIRLIQILRNLASNALKFTPAEGKLTIRISWEPAGEPCATEKVDKYTLKNGEVVTMRRHGTVSVHFIDTGVGMNEGQLQSLFKEPWTQFNASETQEGKGSGLGLFISQSMAMQHGGQLKASSRGIGFGSTFTLELPLYHAPEEMEEGPQLDEIIDDMAVPESAESSASCRGSLRLLVVDDVQSNRKLLSRLARNRHHRVDEAIDGRDAVNKVQAAMKEEDPYDCILMDHEMPVLKGPGAVREIREMYCDAFIVGVTGNVLEEDLRAFIASGADAVLAKPVKFYRLESLWVEHRLLNNYIPASPTESDP